MAIPAATIYYNPFWHNTVHHFPRAIYHDLSNHNANGFLPYFPLSFMMSFCSKPFLLVERVYFIMASSEGTEETAGNRILGHIIRYEPWRTITLCISIGTFIQGSQSAMQRLINQVCDDKTTTDEFPYENEEGNWGCGDCLLAFGGCY